MLRELGVNPEKDSLDLRDRLTAASHLVDMSQFRSRPEDFPSWAADPWGKVLWQFKGFAYNQTRFIAKETIGELRAGRTGRGLRNLLLLATVFPMGGELIRALKDFLMGREPKEFDSLLQRWLDDLVTMGTLGMVSDFARSSSMKGRALEWAVGPTLSGAADVATSGAKVATGGDAGPEVQRLAKQHLPLGRVWVDRLVEAMGR